MNVPERTWTAARGAQLKSCFDAGLSCSQIADEIGVSRNAVIGKINRLRLAPRDRVIAKPRQRKVALRLVTQHDILAALRSAPPPAVEEVPFPHEPRCSLAELCEGKCRWPIGVRAGRASGSGGGKPGDALRYCAPRPPSAYPPAPGQPRARR